MGRRMSMWYVQGENNLPSQIVPSYFLLVYINKLLGEAKAY